MCSFIFGNTTFIPRTAAKKVLSRFCFLFSVFFFVSFRFVSFRFVFVFLFFVVVVVVVVVFAREDKSAASLACLATQVYFPHSPLSLSFFFPVREDENMLETSLATQAFRHTGIITTQDYFLTGLFCHRFIRHMGQLYAIFLPHRSISFARSKYCTPQLPQRTIFHIGLLHALRSNRSLQSSNKPHR